MGLLSTVWAPEDKTEIKRQLELLQSLNDLLESQCELREQELVDLRHQLGEQRRENDRLRVKVDTNNYEIDTQVVDLKEQLRQREEELCHLKAKHVDTQLNYTNLQRKFDSERDRALRLQEQVDGSFCDELNQLQLERANLLHQARQPNATVALYKNLLLDNENISHRLQSMVEAHQKELETVTQKLKIDAVADISNFYKLQLEELSLEIKDSNVKNNLDLMSTLHKQQVESLLTACRQEIDDKHVSVENYINSLLRLAKAEVVKRRWQSKILGERMQYCQAVATTSMDMLRHGDSYDIEHIPLAMTFHKVALIARVVARLQRLGENRRANQRQMANANANVELSEAYVEKAKAQYSS